MGTTKIFRVGLIATVGVAGLTLTANAQSRYGSVYNYESGRNCGQACVPAPVTPAANSRYGAPVVAAPTYNAAPVYVDCVQAGTCAPQPAVVYTQPSTVYTPPAPTYSQHSYTQSVQMEPVNCPSGTTAQPDGTCMQTGSTYSSGTTYSSGSTSTYSAPTMSMEPVNCPSGTTAQPDGTCMQTGSSYSSSSTYSSSPSYSTGSTSSYSSGYSSASSTPVNCPAGTTAQPDGTCMQGGSSSYAGSSIELYTGDAASSTPSYGYGSDGSYGATDYLPIRK